MRIAFYAPMKAPTDPLASGDRRMAQLFMQALAQGGHAVTLASRLSSHDGRGDAGRQRRIAELGARMAERLVRRYRALPHRQRPELWFTYHLYHKAPDWLGPRVSEALDLPYLVAEASVAAKQAGGRWDLGYRSCLAALAAARAVITINSADRAGIEPWLAASCQAIVMKPFLDAAPFRRAAGLPRETLRTGCAARGGLDAALPWLLTVAMLRAGDKLDSYRQLGLALTRLLDRPWQLLVIGDGAARSEVMRALAPLGARVRYAGTCAEDEIARACAAADLMVWPAIREAFGMALLEAQAAGLPVVAGSTGGVPDIVAHGATGLLAPIGDAGGFADAVALLLADKARRRTFGAAASRKAAAEHDLAAAAVRLDTVLAAL